MIYKRLISSVIFAVLIPMNMLLALAQETPDIPYLEFSWKLVDGTGEEIENPDIRYEGSAPIVATMSVKAVCKDAEGNVYDYDDAEFIGAWRVWHERGQMEEPYLSRAEPITDLYFNNYGTDSIAYVGYVKLGDVTIDITPEYNRLNQHIFCIKTYESKLVFPNAFSPNGDEFNEIFMAKEYQSIVDFHASIFNRWGMKLYEWDDVRKGWDGTYHGKPVKDGVYYIQVKAKGADGQIFNIKKDVNLMRGYDENYLENNNNP